MWRFAVEGYTQTVKQLLFTEQELLSLRSKLVTGLRLRGTHWLTDVITVVAKLRFTVPLEVLCGWQEFIMPLLLCSLIWSPCTAYCKQGTDAKGRDYEIMWVFCFFFYTWSFNFFLNGERLCKSEDYANMLWKFVYMLVLLSNNRKQKILKQCACVCIQNTVFTYTVMKI